MAFLMTQDTSRSCVAAYLASRSLNSASTRTGGRVVSRIGVGRPLLVSHIGYGLLRVEQCITTFYVGVNGFPSRLRLRVMRLPVVLVES